MNNGAIADQHEALSRDVDQVAKEFLRIAVKDPEVVDEVFSIVLSLFCHRSPPRFRQGCYAAHMTSTYADAPPSIVLVQHLQVK